MSSDIPSRVVSVSLIMGCPDHGFDWVCTAVSAGDISMYFQLGRFGEFHHGMHAQIMVSVGCVPQLLQAMSRGIPSWVVPVNLIMGWPDHGFHCVRTTGGAELECPAVFPVGSCRWI